MTDSNQNNFYDRNDYSQSDNLSCNCSLKSEFANSDDKCTNDIHYLYNTTRDIVLSQGVNAYSFEKFKKQLYSAQVFLTAEIRLKGKNVTDFIGERIIPIMLESSQDDGEMGRHNVYPLPKDAGELITVEFNNGCCCFKEMKPLHHGDFSHGKCKNCTSEKPSENLNECNQCKICLSCKKRYVKQNGCLILPFRTHPSNQIYVKYRTIPQPIMDDQTNIDFPAEWFNVLTHFTALSQLSHGDGNQSGLYSHVTDLYKLFHDQMIESYRRGDDNEEDVRWNDQNDIYIENYGIRR